MAITLLLVDDQSIILDGLEALLGQDPGMRVLGRASNGAEAVELAKALQPDVVVMDISMPVMDGIEA
ncbi:MAG: response regulator transcription factor, partial [Bacteroidetes bacterium]|nr:response regulator transcription factor [Bacteroidota bacterium]